MNQLINFYCQLLVAAGATIENDEIYYDGKPITIMVRKKSKQLVLPTTDRLKNSDWSKTVAFHPTGESITAGQSEVINILTNLIGLKLFNQIQLLSATIIDVCANEEYRKSFTAKQLKLFEKFNSIDKATNQLYLNIANKTTGVCGEHPLFTIRLDRGGEICGINYNRTAKLIPYILKSEDRLCGVKPSTIRSAENIKAIYATIFPESLEFGTNADRFPYFIALLTLFKGVAEHLNKVKSVLGKLAPVGEINLSWTDDIGNLSSFAKLIPQALEGNIGVSLNKEAPKADKPAASNVSTAVVGNRIGLSQTSNDELEEPPVALPKDNKLGLSAPTRPAPINQTVPTPSRHTTPTPYSPPPTAPIQQTWQNYQHQPQPQYQPPIIQPQVYLDPATGQYMQITPVVMPPPIHQAPTSPSALMFNNHQQLQQQRQQNLGTGYLYPHQRPPHQNSGF